MSVTEQAVTAPPVETPLEALPPLPKTPPEAEILELAADIIEREGWAKYNFSVFGKRCAVGGIGAAVNRMTFERGTKAGSRRAAESALAKLLPDASSAHSLGSADQRTIMHFNDWVAHTPDQVVRKMREAAASLTKT